MEIPDWTVFCERYDTAVRALLESACRSGHLGGEDRAKVLGRLRGGGVQTVRRDGSAAGRTTGGQASPATPAVGHTAGRYGTTGSCVPKRVKMLEPTTTEPTRRQVAGGAGERRKANSGLPESTVDPYLWLEIGPEAREWARRHTERTVTELVDDRFEPTRRQALEVFDDQGRIPFVARRGDHLYNFWRDRDHRRGQWRRTTVGQYLTDTPDWDVLIDLDELAAAERENWVWDGADVIFPEGTRALVSLSRHSWAAAVVREFDMTTRQFVADGFTLPEGRHFTCWQDENTVLFGTLSEVGSLTLSGYPRMVNRWRRGQSLGDADLVFAGSLTDTSVWATRNRTPGFERTFLVRSLDRYHSHRYELRDGGLIYLDVPADAGVSIHRQWLLIALRGEWQTCPDEPSCDWKYPAGSLLAADYEEFLAGTAKPHMVFEPDAHTTLSHYAWTRDRLVLVTVRGVASRVETVEPGSWRREPVAGIPATGSTECRDADDQGDEVFLVSRGFLKPEQLLYGTATGPVRPIKSRATMFDAADLIVSERFATSDDGMAVRYLVVTARDAPGPGPTIMGGFGTVQAPFYSGVLGRLWLSRGGTYVRPITRRAGEYGLAWHTQTLRDRRRKVAEDFATVAKDLVAQGITTSPQLGAIGGSNGVLAVDAMLTQYPQLFGALVCSSPLMDMRRYHLHWIGRCWVSDYSNPDDGRCWVSDYSNPDDLADWEFISKYSPYQNISPDRCYPRVLMIAPGNAERVDPGHARKMVAALEAAGQPVLYYEYIEGGHGAATDHDQAAFLTALVHRFLWRALWGERASA